MSNATNDRTVAAQTRLSEAGLRAVSADFDSKNTCYLSGTVDSRDQIAHAVAIAFAQGAETVRDGLIISGDAESNVERHHAAGPAGHRFPSTTSALQKGNPSRHGGVR